MPGGVLRAVEKGIFPGKVRWLSVSSVAVIGSGAMVPVAEAQTRSYFSRSRRVIVGIVAKLEPVVLKRSRK